MQAKKSLGQNFLRNDTIIHNIVSLFDVEKNDLIIEIGPGMGALTEKLTQLPSSLICIEIDQDMRPFLEKYESDKCHIIYEDILKTNLKELINNRQYNNLYIIGNLPYYITSPIITYLINSNIDIQEMIFMVQNEVADRFCARPGHKEFGYITLFINYFFDVQKRLFVGKENFYPIPKVDSAVIKLTRKESNKMIDTENYFNFLKKAFQYKRKTLKNNLREYDFNLIKDILKAHQLDENVRPEDLSQEVFMEIFEKIGVKKN